MRLRNFYLQENHGRKGKKSITMYAATLFVGLFLFGTTTISRAAVPTVTGANPAGHSVCANSGTTDVSVLLAITDPDVGETLTWSLLTAPMHGTASAAAVEISTGGSVVPTGITYTTGFGYSGTDMFVVNVTDGTNSIQVTVNMLVAPNPGVIVSGIMEVCHGATSVGMTFTTNKIFDYLGASQEFVVPAGVTNLFFDLQGAAGGADSSLTAVPGKGGRLQGVLAVTPGQQLIMNLGGIGNTGSLTGAAGGYNGGGNSFGYGGSGGGASDIRLNGTGLANRVAVAGGGAGSGYMGSFSVFGGNGGTLEGANGGENPDASYASGGTQIAGGAGATFTASLPGMDGALGLGGDGSFDGVSGGGGAGFFGGGGGSSSGGGGGSSYFDAGLISIVSNTQGDNSSNGTATILYPVPATYTYSITWDAAALTAGFTNVASTSFPGGTSFPIAIPVTADPDTYTGTLFINDGVCTYNEPISLWVKPIPDVTATADQAPVCNGDMTADVMFAGSLPGTAYNWTNDMATIGLGGSGSGDIMSFTATNTSTTDQVATITVTPRLNNCDGTPDVFTYTVKPTPTIFGSTALGYVCNNATFNYTATSAVAGTSFAWSRDAMAGPITAPAASGTNVISEAFNNTSANPVSVVYTFTLTASGCSNIQSVTVTVNPTPVYDLTPLVGTICSGGTVTFVQSSSTIGVTHSWSRATVTGITPAGTSGTGLISESLTNTTPDPITVFYVDTLHINGCTNTQGQSVVVNPMPVLTSSVTGSICNNATFNYTATSATTGTTFTWERFPVFGVTTAYASGTNTVSETHTNTQENPITVTYIFSLSANGCTNFQNVTVTVNPTPMLNTTLAPAAVCDSTFFNYVPGSNTVGASFPWTRAVVANISNPAGSGTGTINERLRNTATFPVSVTYVINSTINGCSNPQNVVVVVNPRPRLTNTPLNPKVCDSTVFTFAPTSATVGFTTAWDRAFVAGIGALPNSGTGNINELLKNNTNTNLDVKYVYTVSANGCSNIQTVNVTVHPTPKLSSPLTDSACSGAPYSYTPTTNVIPPVTYAWTRAAVTSITPGAGSGNGNINETLVNSSIGSVNVVYVYTLTVGASCTNTQNVTVKVRPAAEVPVITTMPATTACNGTMYQNFGAAPAPTNVTYTWSAVNAEVYATGADNMYSLVNFTTPGVAEVKLAATIGTTGCTGVATYTVNVNNTNAHAPKVIYTKGKFICLLNDVKSFQWGYDDATTLDSTVIAGEINQSYFLSAPSFPTRHYWVMTGAGDCMQKTYYNRPNDNTPRVINDMDEELAGIKVYPNPAIESVNVEMTGITGATEIQLVNMLGQVLTTVNADAGKATISVSSLPSGIYMIDCYVGGLKTGTAKFVKN